MAASSSSESGGTAAAPGALAAERVRVRFGPVLALDDVSLTVAAGEWVALVGESGAGKSTLLRAFNRLTDPASGTVSVGGRDVRSLEPVALRRGVGYVSQDAGLLPHWTVERNAALVPWLLDDPAPADRSRRALELVGLDPATFAGRWPRELSGGQRQRVAIARAIAARPPIVLLDEAFGALDAITRNDMHDLLRRLRSDLAFTALLVTHDLAEAIRLADRVAVMRDGRIEQIAPPAELLARPATDYVARLLTRAGVRAA